MTALCVFVDLQDISLLLYKSDTEFWYKKFPYVYNDSVFSASFKPEEFYTSLFELFCTEHSVKLADCEILVSGFLEPPIINIPNVKLTTSLYEILNQIQGVNHFMVNSHGVLTKNECMVSAKVRALKTAPEMMDSDEENYYANLELYPHVVSTDVATQIDIDTNISTLLNCNPVINPKFPVIFGGSRFTNKSMFPELDYLLMLNFINKPGVYDLRRDLNNSLVLGALLKMYQPQITFEQELSAELTLVASNNALECLMQTDQGTSQLLQLEKNRLLVIPSSKDERVKLEVKARDLGGAARSVATGNVGIIFDTREKKIISAQDIKVFSMGLKSFKEALV